MEVRLSVGLGLFAGDIFSFRLDNATMSIRRPNNPSNEVEGYQPVTWDGKSDKKRVACINDQSSFLDFMMLVAATHHLSPKLYRKTRDRIELILCQK